MGTKLKKVTSAKRLKNNLPFYLLFGLYQTPEALYSNSSLDCSFLNIKNEYAWNSLWKWAREISNEIATPENVIGMVYTGWRHWSGSDIHRTFFKDDDIKLNELWKKYPVDSLSLLKCILRGLDQIDWYQKTLNAFIEELPQYDADLFVRCYAVNSPQSHPRSNLMAAIYGYECLFGGNRSSEELRGFDSVKKMMMELGTGAFEEKPTRRKSNNLYNAIMGNGDAVVVDTWVLIAMNRGGYYFWKKVNKWYIKCRKREYDLIEYYMKSLAQTSGFAPREVTVMAWAGIRYIEGKYKETETRELILALKQKRYIK